MISESELLEAIQTYKSAPASFQNCERLSVFFTVYDHLYGKDDRIKVESLQESISKPKIKEIRKEIITVPESTSDFLMAVEGMDAKQFWRVINELVSTLEVINPRLYESFLRKLKETA